MDDLILAARLFEKGYVPNLEGGGIRNRLWQGGKNLARGLAGRVAQTRPIQGVRQVMGEGQASRYNLPPNTEASNIPSDKVSANVARVDTDRLAFTPPPAPAATAPENQPENLPQEDTDGDGQLTANDTQERTMNTEVKQTLAPDGSVDTTQTTHTTTDKNADGLDDTTGQPVSSPDPNTNATPATKPTATQNTAGRQQVANAQKLAETSLGSVGAGVATMGLRPAYGLLQRYRGKKQLENLAAGAGGQTNANMIRASRADGTEFLDDHWNLHKARMEARERATTEAIRNAYR